MCACTYGVGRFICSIKLQKNCPCRADLEDVKCAFRAFSAVLPPTGFCVAANPVGLECPEEVKEELPLTPNPVFNPSNFQSPLLLLLSSHPSPATFSKSSTFLCAFLPFHGYPLEKFCSNTSSEVNSIIPFIQKFI